MEVLHDGAPSVCIGDAAFAYINAFTSHINAGFFRGVDLPDPAKILVGTGKFMRHVKVRLDNAVNEDAIEHLITHAYTDMKSRLKHQRL